MLFCSGGFEEEKEAQTINGENVDALRCALDAAKKKNISTVVVASNSGKTANEFFELAKQDGMRIIVVTHDEGRPESERRFSQDIRRKLLAHNVTVYTHNPRMILLRKIIAKLFGRFGFPRWYKHLREIKDKYGTGIKVCHIIVQMLIEGKFLSDDRVIAIAGSKSGADSAAVFSIKPQNKWPILEEVILKS